MTVNAQRQLTEAAVSPLQRGKDRRSGGWTTKGAPQGVVFSLEFRGGEGTPVPIPRRFRRLRSDGASSSFE